MVDPMLFEWFMKAIAWKVQYPELAWNMMLILFSEMQGTGKDTTIDFIQALFGAKFVQSYKGPGRMFEEDWTSHLERTVLVRMSELGEEYEIGKYNEKLKATITEPTFVCTTKNTIQRTVNRYYDIIATTNNRTFMKFTTNDRRFVPIHVAEEKLSHDADPEGVERSGLYEVGLGVFHELRRWGLRSRQGLCDEVPRGAPGRDHALI